jgi:hypothetical protein
MNFFSPPTLHILIGQCARNVDNHGGNTGTSAIIGRFRKIQMTNDQGAKSQSNSNDQIPMTKTPRVPSSFGHWILEFGILLGFASLVIGHL